MALAPLPTQARVSENPSKFPFADALVYGAADTVFGCVFGFARSSAATKLKVFTAGLGIWTLLGPRTSTKVGLAGAELYLACKTGHYVYQAIFQWAEYWSIESLQQLQRELYSRFTFSSHIPRIALKRWHDSRNQNLALQVLMRARAIIIKEFNPEDNTWNPYALNRAKFASAFKIFNETYRFARGLQFRVSNISTVSAHSLCDAANARAFFEGDGLQREMNKIYNDTHTQLAGYLQEFFALTPDDNVKDLQLLPGDVGSDNITNPFKIGLRPEIVPELDSALR
jgi:hypothetical protein